MPSAVSPGFLFAIVLMLCVSPQARAQPATQPENAPDLNAAFKEVSKIIGVDGKRTDETYTIRLPRDDHMIVVDGNIVPPAAGLESVLNIYWCSCGGFKSVGQFVLMEYEANDVIDALRKDYSGHGPLFSIASAAPMFLNDHPRVVSLRFQGEGDAAELAKVLREAMRWIGDERGKRSAQP